MNPRYLLPSNIWNSRYFLFAAYTLEEVDEKTKLFRESVNYHIEDGESTINVSENFYSVAIIIHHKTFSIPTYNCMFSCVGT